MRRFDVMFIAASQVIVWAKKQLEKQESDQHEQAIKAMDFALEAIEYGEHHGYQTDDLRNQVIAIYNSHPSLDQISAGGQNAFVEHQERQVMLLAAVCSSFYQDNKEKIEMHPHKKNSRDFALTPVN